MNLKKIRIAGLIVVAALSIGLVGCGSKDKDKAEDTPKATEAPEETEEVEETPEETEEPTEVDTSEDSSFEPGIITATGYESAWLNLKYTTPQGYVMATKEEIDAYIASQSEQLSEALGEESLDAAASATSYEMIAQASDNTSMVMLLAEPANGLDPTEYVESLKGSLSRAGMIVPDTEPEVQEIGGIDFTILPVVSQDQTAAQAYLVGLYDNRIVTFIVTTPIDTAEESFNAIMSGFDTIQ